MTAPSKDALSRWIPSIVAVLAVLAHVVMISRWSATTDSRVAALETKAIPVERLYELFPSRVEWVAQNNARNGEIHEIKAMVRDTNAKIDRLYQSWMGRTTP